MKIAFYFVFFSCALLNSCKTADSDAPVKFDVSGKLTFHELPYPDIIGNPMRLIQLDSFLVINDFMGDTLLPVYNLNSGSIDRKLIVKGNGPNEMISPLIIDPFKDKLMIFNNMMFKYYSLPIADVHAGNLNLHEEFQLPIETIKIKRLDDSLYVCSGYFDKRFAMLDGNGNFLYEFGEFPNYWEGESDIPSSSRAMFHQCLFKTHPFKKQLVVCSHHVLEIYDYEEMNTVPKLNQSILLGKYSYRYTTGNMIQTTNTDDTEVGSADLFCSANYIYVLYCNYSKTHKDRKTSTIMVFDWNGKPVKKMEADHIIYCFTIDEANKVGYCIMPNPDFMLASFSFL